MQPEAKGPLTPGGDEDSQSYILYSLDGELYGTPMLSTREVIKLGEIKSVPYMVPHFRGVINLRGQIVGVVDLRLKFGLKAKPDNGLILVVETSQGPLGAIVDDLISVEKVARSEIDSDSPVQTRVPLSFFIGVAKIKDRLVNMVDIANCLSSEELRAA